MHKIEVITLNNINNNNGNDTNDNINNDNNNDSNNNCSQNKTFVIENICLFIDVYFTGLLTRLCLRKKAERNSGN